MGQLDAGFLTPITDGVREAHDDLRSKLNLKKKKKKKMMRQLDAGFLTPITDGVREAHDDLRSKLNLIKKIINSKVITIKDRTYQRAVSPASAGGATLGSIVRRQWNRTYHLIKPNDVIP